jgi:hypothetical protein
MTFPVSPTNGDTTTVNGISYIYNSTVRSWTRITSPLANITVSNNANVTNVYGTLGSFTGNVKANQFQTDTGLFWSNGTAFSSGLSSAQVNARIWAQNVFWG